MEKWVNVKYEGLGHYQVSDKGNVAGLRGLMRTRPNGRGYYMLGLRYPNGGKQKTFNVHRLVAEHFINKVEGKLYVNHIDGDKSNNVADNLEWVTQSENQLHAYETNLQIKTPEQVARLRSYAKKKRRPIRVVNERLRMNQVFESIAEASKHVDCNEKTLRNALKGRNESRLGYEVTYFNGG